MGLQSKADEIIEESSVTSDGSSGSDEGHRKDGERQQLKERMKKALLKKLEKAKSDFMIHGEEGGSSISRMQYKQDMLQMENRLRTLILNLLEKPVNLMRN